MSWKIAHACVRGSSHVRSGLPNQDAAQCTVIPGGGSVPTVAVAAVSDGHGGARHFRSQIGSSLAVSTSVEILQRTLSRSTDPHAPAALEADRVQDLQRTLVDSWLAAVTADLESHPLTEEELGNLEKHDGAESRKGVEEYPVLAYGATLLVAAATDNLILYLQLGDGEILSVDGGGETTRPLPEDGRLIGNQTTSLCQPEAWKEFRAAWMLAPDLPSLVLLSTDGYSNSFRSDDDFLKIGADYLGIIREQGIGVLSEELPEILKEATQQGSGDDITLAILQGELRKSPPHADGAPVKPRISPESRSALIEQLKARHSSQHRRLDELSTRLEQTRKDNRRLQLLILLLILAALGTAAVIFRGKIFPHTVDTDPGIKPHGTIPGSKTPASVPDAPPKKSAKPAPTQWVLKLPNGESLTLQKGMDIQRSQIIPTGSDAHYARVAQDKGKMQLINDSNDAWKIQPLGGGKSYTVKNPGFVPLDSKSNEITLIKGVKVTLTPAPDAPPNSTPANDQPPTELN